MLSDMKFNGHDWYAKPFDLRDDAAAKSKFVIGELYEGWILDSFMCFEMDNYPAELEWIYESSMQMYRYMQIQIIPPVKWLIISGIILSKDIYYEKELD